MLWGFRDPLQTVRIFSGDGPGESVIRLRRHPVAFQIRGAMDAWCLKETWLERSYERYGFPVQPAWTVVDVGAGFGDFTVLAALASGSGTVIAIEPFLESVTLLRANLARNRVTNVRVEPVALGGKSGHVVLDDSVGDPIMRPTISVPDASVANAIPATTLDQLLLDQGVGHVDLLKIDCEGAEYEILFASTPELLRQIDRIVMEVHDRLTEFTHADMTRFLTDAGYTVTYAPNAVHPDQIGYLWAIRTDLHKTITHA